MRFATNVMTTGALALLLMPAFRLNAAGPPVSPALTPGTSTSAVASGQPTSTGEPVVTEGSAGASLQSDSSGVPRSTGKTSGAPKIDLGIVYSYVRAVPTDAAGNRMVWLNGGSTSINFHLNRHLGIVGDFGGYADSRLRLGTSSSDAVMNSSGNAFTYLLGPRVLFGKQERFTPFVQALFGAVHASAVTLPSGCTSGGCTPLPSENAFAMTAGGGLDWNLSRHFGIRILQAEYLMTRLTDISSGSTGTQNDMRLSSGIVLRMGGGRKPQAAAISQPLTAECSIDKSQVQAGSGDMVGVHAQANDPQNRPMSYAWTATGGTVTGTGADVQWNSADVAAGSYTVSVKVSDDGGGSASCSADVQVQAPQAPVATPLHLSCAADQTSVLAGDVVQITATPADATHDPLTYSWTASEGEIAGSGSTVKLDTTGFAAGSSTVTAHATDAQGDTGDCSVTIEARALTPVEQKLALHSIYFPTAQPTVEDPTGGLVASQKAILVKLASDFKTYLQTNPTAKLLLEGHSDPRASVEYNQALSQRRVESAKKFLIGEGVPAENILTKAFGEEENLSEDQVRSEVMRNPELTPEERQKMLDHMTTIVLASDRRVEIVLTTTGQRSVRQFPFNAVDSLTLLSQDAPK